jgi:hypothetical protein
VRFAYKQVKLFSTLSKTGKIMKKSSVCLLLALGGAVVGAAVAILVTPQSGKELRGKLRTAFNNAQHRMHNGHCECYGDDCDCDE